MADNIRIGVVGAGYWGKNLIRNFHALGALTAFCDSDSGVRMRMLGLLSALVAPISSYLSQTSFSIKLFNIILIRALELKK